MPINIKLTHPILGLIFNQTVYHCFEEKTVNGLKYKYGKKYNECTLETTEIPQKQVIYLPTERVYANISTAVKSTKYTKYEIQKHLDGNLPENIEPLFKYYEKDKEN